MSTEQHRDPGTPQGPTESEGLGIPVDQASGGAMPAAEMPTEAAPGMPAAAASAAPSTPATPGTATAPDEPRRLRPRTGPIVWGAIILAFCVYIAAQTVAPGSVDTTTFVIASVIGLGVLLLAVGLAVLARNARR